MSLEKPGLAISMQSVMNLSYKSSRMVNYQKPPKFEQIYDRAKKNKELYLKRSDLRD